MITKKLKLIFGLSIPVFIAHGVEEYMTHFNEINPPDQAIFGLLSSLPNHGATFVAFQLMFWLILIVSLLLLLGGRLQFYTFSIIGVVFLYEIHHIIKAVVGQSYYPGVYTSLAFPVFAALFWREWVRANKLEIK